MAKKIIISLFLLSLITACSSSWQDRLLSAKNIATNHGFKPLSIKTNQFNLYGFSKINKNSDIINLYIEGDGFAWIDRYTISRNPTPKEPIGLRLAVLDNSNNVIYLGRPCQYINLSLEKECSDKYWTSHRFSEEVINSYQYAIKELKKQLGFNKINLIGFSGGGGIATILASRRNDVHSLRTIAGNLDHVSLNKTRNVSYLSGSLNPIDIAKKLKKLPQIHYSGSEDKVVPSWVANKFIESIDNPKCTSNKVIKNISHIKGWENLWKIENNNIPKCLDH